jgi:Ca2+-binding RTX toxin-like protein
MGGTRTWSRGARIGFAALGVLAAIPYADKALGAQVVAHPNRFFAAVEVSALGKEDRKLAVQLGDRGTTVVVRSARGDLHAGAGCDPTGDRGRRVKCSLGLGSDGGRPFGFVTVIVETGRGDDRVALTGRGRFKRVLPLVFVATGSGADRVIGGRGPESVAPGAGNDAVEGGLGSDYLVAESHADGTDRFDGGPGFNSADYSSRTRGLTVDLSAETAGQGTEGDVLEDVRAVLGGSADDSLSGGGAANALLGGSGPDLVTGGAGDDFLDGERGADEILGGPGRDSVFSFDRSADSVDCGPQQDFFLADANDDVTSCERRLELLRARRMSRTLERRAKFEARALRTGLVPAPLARAIRARQVP